MSDFELAQAQSPPYIGIVQNEISIQEDNHWEMQA